MPVRFVMPISGGGGEGRDGGREGISTLLTKKAGQSPKKGTATKCTSKCLFFLVFKFLFPDKNVAKNNVLFILLAHQGSKKAASRFFSLFLHC